jgi:penicillin amidase
MAPTTSSKSIRRRRLILRLVGLTLPGLGAFLGLGWKVLHGSLAQLDGVGLLTGLSAPVSLERDHLGVVTLTASNRLDATRCLGLFHAQERFFQMDQLRRAGAGESAALFGPAVLELDRRV